MLLRSRDPLLRTGMIDGIARCGGSLLLSTTGQLDLLATLYGTDKSRRHHGYTEYYRRHLGYLRFKPITLVEIGVGGDADDSLGGASLRMWRDYFFRGNIVGVDLHEKALRRLGPRVEVRQADQSSREDLEHLVRTISTPAVIIDDGSHVPSHIRLTFDILFPSLAPGGWFIIEDLHTSFMDEFGGSTGSDETTTMGLIGELAESVQVNDHVFSDVLGWMPEVHSEDVASVHVYPGICFIEKCGDRS